MNSANDFKIILLVISPLILAGCGGTDVKTLSPIAETGIPGRPATQTTQTTQITQPTTQLTTVSFEGTWETPCKRVDAFEHGLQMKTNYTQSVTYTGNIKVAKLSYFYINSTDTDGNVACTNPKYEIIITSNIVFGIFINPGTQNQYRQIDFFASQATLAINHDKVYYVNNHRFDDIYRTDIGITNLRNNWVQHIHQEITQEFTYGSRNGAKRFSYFAIGDQVYDIAKIVGNKLYFGDQGGNKDVNGRPITLGSAFFIKK
ncbi:MAG: hypothetical protein KAH18_13355 [Psychromonas sp.]|nr:hypothetical protein [Psychromonas sp.]